jgi:hypothetical protein
MATPVGYYLQELAYLDVFYYVLPFLLVFAVVFAILQKTQILGGEESRGINAVIAITIGLLSLQFDKVPLFFRALMPNLAVGLSVILAAILLLGLFFKLDDNRGKYLFMSISGIVAIWVILSSISDYSWWTGSFWYDNLPTIIAGVIIIGAIIAVVGGGRRTP